MRVARTIAVLAIAASPAFAQFSTPLGRGESETAQLGGVSRTMGAARASDLGVLRCPAPLAIVGLRLSRGRVLSAAQLICADVQCAGGSCGWRESRYGPSAGTPQPGDASIVELCGANGVASGFRGYAAGPYARDLRVECGAAGGSVGGQRAYAGRTGPPPDGPGAVAAACGGSGASAVSYALAPLAGGSGGVVQAVSMYCGPARATPASTPAPKPVSKGPTKGDAGTKKGGRAEAGLK